MNQTFTDLSINVHSDIQCINALRNKFKTQFVTKGGASLTETEALMSHDSSDEIIKTQFESKETQLKIELTPKNNEGILIQISQANSETTNGILHNPNMIANLIHSYFSQSIQSKLCSV